MREQGDGARLPLLSRTGLDALRADASVARGSSQARGGIAAGQKAALHARLSTAAVRRPDLCVGRAARSYFESLARRCKNPKAAANWVINNLRAKLTETRTTLADLKFKPGHILELIELVESRKISSSIAQQVFVEMFASGESPDAIVEKKGLGPSQRHRGHRRLLRSGHRRQSGAGVGLQSRQSGRAEFPQRPGDETEQRQSEPEPHRRDFGAEAEVSLVDK